MKHKQIAYVTIQNWDPDDEFLAISVGNIQVFREDGWKPGQRVEILVEVRNPPKTDTE